MPPVALRHRATRTALASPPSRQPAGRCLSEQRGLRRPQGHDAGWRVAECLYQMAMRRWDAAPGPAAWHCQPRRHLPGMPGPPSAWRQLQPLPTCRSQPVRTPVKRRKEKSSQNDSMRQQYKLVRVLLCNGCRLCHLVMPRLQCSCMPGGGPMRCCIHEAGGLMQTALCCSNSTCGRHCNDNTGQRRADFARGSADVHLHGKDGVFRCMTRMPVLTAIVSNMTGQHTPARCLRRPWRHRRRARRRPWWSCTSRKRSQRRGCRRHPQRQRHPGRHARRPCSSNAQGSSEALSGGMLCSLQGDAALSSSCCMHIANTVTDAVRPRERLAADRTWHQMRRRPQRPSRPRMPQKRPAHLRAPPINTPHVVNGH